MVVGTLYTHHQKIVLVDSQAAGNDRRLTAFIGGLDICDGRYDTPKHSLFRSLQTVHKDDYHNPTFTATIDAGGPREPWHDLHCKIEGPAAYDVLTNFEQRWRKATKWHEFGQRFKRISRWHDDALINLDRISWILSPTQNEPNDDHHLWVSDEDNPENWHVQVFRSIDSGSVKGFPKSVAEAENLNLVCGKNLVIDTSIHTAYVNAIRSSQHFVYIENQYFLGSSYNWPSYKHAGIKTRACSSYDRADTTSCILGALSQVSNRIRSSSTSSLGGTFMSIPLFFLWGSAAGCGDEGQAQLEPQSVARNRSHLPSAAFINASYAAMLTSHFALNNDIICCPLLLN
eukprot:Gb_19032 [translate_table: standard]